MTRVGMLARADDRGLGHLTHEFYRAVKPDKTLVIDMRDPAFPTHVERYFEHHVSVDVVDYDHRAAALPPSAVQHWLHGLDVVYTAETFYDSRFVDWAREAGVRTIIHGMPELYNHGNQPSWSQPDEWWWPTGWMTSKVPAGPIVPVPVPSGARPRAGEPYRDEPLHVLHPAGRPAIGDRDGTVLFVEALHFVNEPVHVTIVTQHGALPRDLPSRSNISYDVWLEGVEDRFEMYAGQHVTVLPRRYGGLSLKVIESLGCGVPVIMPDIAPNSIWPGPRVKAHVGQVQRVPLGNLRTVTVRPADLAKQINYLAANREAVHDEQVEAGDWADENTWEQHMRTYDEHLGR